MSKYRTIPAVGQINDMACWAASLKWWYKAAMSINASQTKLWELYKARATQQGGMPDSDMKFIIGQNGMRLFEFPIASSFTFDKVRDMLMCGPIFTAFTEFGTWKRHVNVIYDISGDSNWADVRCMEPQDKASSGGKWKGKHIKRGLTDFNSIGSVWAGIHRDNYSEWVNCFGNL
jgi:hypothetical protein